MLEFKNVTKSFGEIVALKNLSFKVNDGEFIFISGPSGAGKTTLLRLILREILPDEGEIVIDERDITKISRSDVPRLRQNIGTVFQDFKVLPERTVRENIEVALADINLPQKEWNARVDHVLDLVGLSSRADLFPSQLSGGELQRVSMARALVVNPKIVLADEPTGNLDWDTAEKIMELFDKINKEGKTILMATHHKLIISKFKKRVIELKEGEVKLSENEEQKTIEEVTFNVSDKDKKDKKKSKKD